MQDIEGILEREVTQYRISIISTIESWKMRIRLAVESITKPSRLALTYRHLREELEAAVAEPINEVAIPAAAEPPAAARAVNWTDPRSVPSLRRLRHPTRPLG